MKKSFEKNLNETSRHFLNLFHKIRKNEIVEENENEENERKVKKNKL